MLIMPYGTESKSRNVLASPLGEEGHEVAKGWTVVRMIMILDVDVTAERRHYKTHCPRGQSATLGPKGHRPLSEANTTLLHNPRRSRAPLFYKTCGVSRHRYPLNLHAAGVSKGEAALFLPCLAVVQWYGIVFKNLNIFQKFSYSKGDGHHRIQAISYRR